MASAETHRMDRSVGIDVVRLTEGAARAAAVHMGRGDESEIFRSAAVGFRDSLDEVNLDVALVAGQVHPEAEAALKATEPGEGATVEVDLGIKLVECLTACALGGRNAMSAMVVAPRGSIQPMPNLYMDKIVCGPEAAGALSFDVGHADLVGAVADAKGVRIEELTVTVLDRPRNREWIEVVRSTGARVRLIADGDLAAAIATAVPDSGVDLLVGSGGALEGWLAAAALRGLGGGFLSRFLARSVAEKRSVVEAGFTDPDAPVTMDQILPEALIFSATGITDGDVLRGVRYLRRHVIADSLMVRTTSETVRWVRSERPVFSDSPA